MVMIPQIQESVEPQGKIEIMRRGQANANDFGGQIADGMERLATGLNEAANQAQQFAETQDVTNVHVAMAKARADWTQNLQDRASQAQPGDDTFAPTLMKDMGSYFDQGAASASTLKGQQLWARSAADMASEFGQKAIGIQSDLAGKAAINDYNSTVDSAGRAVHADETQLGPALEQVRNAIDDPNGMYSRIPSTVRDKLKQQAEEQLNYAAAHGFTERHPDVVLGSMDPAMVAQFKPFEKLLQSNTAPGGNVTLSPETMAKAPEVAPVAAGAGVNPNIPLAMMDQKGTTPQEPKQLVSSLATLLGTYGGDYSKALTAYYAGTKAVDGAMQLFGSDWQAHVAPAAQAYTQTVMSNAGMVASTPNLQAMAPGEAPQGPPADSGPKAPVPSTLPFLNNIPWEKQAAITQEAVQLQSLRLNMAEKARAEQQLQENKARDAAMDGYIQQIFQPQTYGKFSMSDAVADSALDWQRRNQVVNIYNARVAELKAEGENKSNPTEFRRLFMEIHAPDTDPTKTYSSDNALESYSAGKISFTDFNRLRTEVSQLKDGNTTGFQQQLYAAKRDIESSYAKDYTLSMIPGAAANAAYRFNYDLDAKVATYRADGKNPRTLLDPNSPDFALKPENIAAFAVGSKPALADHAAKVTQAGKAALPLVSNDDDYKKLPPGASYRTSTGAVLVKKGQGSSAPKAAPEPEIEPTSVQGS